MNKIEEYKQEKDGLDILQDIPRYAAEGWEKITDGDKERLKWAGVFFRRQTPGRFMMRLRVPNGFMTAIQLRTIGEISGEFGKGFADITTRQQMQLRWFTINEVPEIWNRLRGVNLISLQTGMDNIRGVIGCPVAGLTPNELFDASPVVRDFTQMFLGNKDYTNLPRKFNVTITGCKEACTHAEAQDIAMTPALKDNRWRRGPWIQRRRRRKDGLGRLSDRLALEFVCHCRRSRGGLQPDRSYFPRPWRARVAHQSASGLSRRSLGRRKISQRIGTSR